MDNVHYYVRDRSLVQGPFNLQELERRVRTRRFSRHHQVSVDKVEWRRAADAIPELFQVGPPPLAPPENGLDFVPDAGGSFEINEPLPPVVTTQSGQSNGVIVIAIGAFTILIPLSLVAWLIMLGVTESVTDQSISDDLKPRLATVQGIHPLNGKKQCYAIVVSNKQVVTPVLAAELEGLKVESRHKDGHSEWHSAHLVTADPVTGLCVLRVDFDRDVEIMALPDSRALPARKASLRLLTPDPEDSRHIERGTLVKVLNADDPDEMLLVEFDDDNSDPKDTPLGRVVVDEQGVLVGMVVSRLPDGKNLCTPAHEIRSKKKEAGKFPNDYVLGPITLPKAPVPGEMPPAEPGQPSDHVDTKAETEPASEEIATHEENMPEKSPKKNRSPKTEKEDEDDENAGGALKRTKRLLTDLGHTIETKVVPLPELPPKTAKKIGSTHLEDVYSKHRPTRDRGLQVRIRSIADEIFRAAEKQPQEYTVAVVEDDEIQAYAFVGGNVIINTGFIDFAADDVEMIRFVLAHEIGHLVLGHVDMPFRRQLLLGPLVPTADIVNIILANSAYNQDFEEEADCYAVDIHRKKSWSTKGGIRFFRKLDEQDLPSDDTDAAVGPVSDLFSSHPDSERRIELLNDGCDP